MIHDHVAVQCSNTMWYYCKSAIAAAECEIVLIAGQVTSGQLCCCGG